jgi:amino acid adenylation domain-containing protein
MIQYNTDLYEPATIRRLAGHLQEFCRGALRQPDRPMWEIPMLSAAERADFAAWNRTDRDIGAATVAALFERQVARTPDATALLLEGEAVSYAELNRRANQLARLLVARGIGPEKVVVLLLPHSAEAVVAQLAVLKAGGAFLPVHLGYPAERIAFMIEDAAAELVVTVRGAAARAGSGPAGVLLIDDPGTGTALGRQADGDLSDADRLRPAWPEQAAYVIYTSGSTGRPKGVAVPHTGLASFVATFAERVGVGAGRRFLQFASLSFDAAFAEFCLSLLAGGTLVIGPRDGLPPGPELAATLTRHAVTHAIIPPAVLLVTEPAPDILPGGYLILAGEAPAAELVSRWARGRHVVDAYGPTESTICASLSAPLGEADLPVIGTPVSNSRVHVLGDRLGRLPVGVAGEAYISGAGLARGYVGQPGLTAGRFVADPYGPPGSRMYRSGDLVRYRADGNLEFLGRADDQIKIRGYRLEPGEVEAALRSHPQVRDAVAVARQDEHTGSRQLVGYLVPAEGQVPDLRELRAFLAAALPDYMIPAHLVTLDAIPLTVWGKVNRNALPAPQPERALGGARSVAPSGPVEQALAEIWQSVLGVTAVGAEDNFFALGGDSILAIRLVAKAARAGFKIKSKDLFQQPTIAALSRFIGVAGHPRASTAGSAAPTAAPGPGGDLAPTAPLTPIQRFLLEGSSRPEAVTQHVVIKMPAEIDKTGLRVALAVLVRQHPALGGSFDLSAGTWTEPARPEVPARLLTETEVEAGGQPGGCRRPRDRARAVGDRRAAGVPGQGDPGHPRCRAPARSRRQPPGGRRYLLAHTPRRPRDRLRPGRQGRAGRPWPRGRLVR